MLPQGTQVLNLAYFQELTDEINSIQLCADLQDRVNEAFASLQATVNGIEAQIIPLKLLMELQQLPTDLQSALTWISNMVTALVNPLVKPLETYIAQLTAITNQIAALVTAIENAAERITQCEITIPVVNIPIPTL